MRGCASVITGLLVTILVSSMGCGQSEITLAEQRDKGPDRDHSIPVQDLGSHDTAADLPSTIAETGQPLDQATLTEDQAIPPEADAKILVPDDPLICKPCTGPESCPADGAKTYMCLHAWYKNSDGLTIDEHYCTLICDNQGCPQDFACNTVYDADGNPAAQVCMAQPYGVCALLP